MATYFLKDHTELPRIDEMPKCASVQCEVLPIQVQRPAVFAIGDTLYVPDLKRGTLTIYQIVEGESVLSITPKSTAVGIESLYISARIISSLSTRKIYTVAELIKHSESELREIPNLGQKALNELKEVLASEGLSLRKE